MCYYRDFSSNKVKFPQALKLFRELEHLTNIGMTLYFLGRLAASRNDRMADARFDEAAEVLKQAGTSPSSFIVSFRVLT